MLHPEIPQIYAVIVALITQWGKFVRIGHAALPLWIWLWKLCHVETISLVQFGAVCRSTVYFNMPFGV